MRNLRFTISYDGTAYYGFQTQPMGNTIQDKLEEAVRLLTGETVKVISSGRTDAGVHARAQVVNFTTGSKIPIERWCLALNSRLPQDIIVFQAEEAPPSFHSRKSAKRKTYCYSIRTSRYPDVFNRQTEFHHPTRLNIEAMRQALQHIIGEHDFTSFCSTRTASESHVRTIYNAWLESVFDHRGGREYPSLIRVYVQGNGFLYNMVRIIVGTLLQIGEGKRSSEEMLHILLAQDRSKAGPTAEAMGLMLWEVEY